MNRRESLKYALGVGAGFLGAALGSVITSAGQPVEYDKTTPNEVISDTSENTESMIGPTPEDVIKQAELNEFNHPTPAIEYDEKGNRLVTFPIQKKAYTEGPIGTEIVEIPTNTEGMLSVDVGDGKKRSIGIARNFLGQGDVFLLSDVHESDETPSSFRLLHSPESITPSEFAAKYIPADPDINFLGTLVLVYKDESNPRINEGEALIRAITVTDGMPYNTDNPITYGKAINLIKGIITFHNGDRSDKEYTVLVFSAKWGDNIDRTTGIIFEESTGRFQDIEYWISYVAPERDLFVPFLMG